MKKLLSFILTVVYLFVAAPAVYSSNGCEIGCEEIQHVKTEDHHLTSVSDLRMEPFSPAVVRSQAILQCDNTFFYHAPVVLGAVPLFLRHCHFRI
ncbi:MAG TPA: hypothetical protein VHD83_11635 [Puia sp.]|nr:hypothetical protein [Puia sp.]